MSEAKKNYEKLGKYLESRTRTMLNNELSEQTEVEVNLGKEDCCLLGCSTV
jgi:hypothetical protein